jgi:hypothetical protein
VRNYVYVFSVRYLLLLLLLPVLHVILM